MSLAKELSDLMGYFEGVKDQLDALDWRRINALLGALEGTLGRARDDGPEICCTIGCGLPVAPRRLHCASHSEVSLGCQKVRTSDGRELGVTVDQLAWVNAVGDA